MEMFDDSGCNELPHSFAGLPVYSNPQLMAMGAEDNLYGASDDKSQGVLVDSFRQYVYGKRRGINSLENEFKVSSKQSW